VATKAAITTLLGRAILAIALLIAPEALAESTAFAVRLAGHGETARIVIDADAPMEFKAFSLSGPDRIVIDLDATTWRLAEPAPAIQLGPVKGLRTGQFSTSTARLVIDLAAPTTLRQSFALPPSGSARFRLVIDLGPGGTAVPPLDFTEQIAAALGEVAPSAAPEESAQARMLAPLPEPPPRATTVPDATEAMEPAQPVLALVAMPAVAASAPIPAPLPRTKPTLARPLIVIDPGHGGDDPGAIARDGTFEKDMTLTLARELRDALVASGRYDVRLTRDRDAFLSLSERVEFARREGADLFLSLHCDALDDPAVRGATVYTVSETASDSEAQALAAKENESDQIGGISFVAATYDAQTADILIDLTRRDTMNASARFAELLRLEVGEVAKLRRNSHRFAGFKVLKAPDVPSALFEMGYMSNAKDLAIIKSKSLRKPVLQALVRATDRYFERVTAMQAP
jgi:N-acetylmuramoyl-L-alanine amidase